MHRLTLAGRRRAVALAIAAGAAGTTGAAPSVEVLSTGPTGLVARVWPGAAERARATSPTGPRTSGFLVAVPAGATPVLRLDQVVATPVRVEPWLEAELPGAPLRLAETAVVGRHRLVRVEVAPLYATERGAMWLEAARVAIDYGTGAGDGATQRSRAERCEGRSRPAVEARAVELGQARGAGADGLDEVVQAAVVNGDQAAPFAAAGSTVRTAPVLAAGGPGTCADCLKVEVRQDGIYRLGYDDLRAAPALVSGDPRQLRLLHRGQEEAIEVDGEADGTFDPGDQIVFFGQANRGPFSDTDVYWLMAPAGVAGRRVARAAAWLPADAELAPSAVVRATVRFEEQAEFYAKLPDAEGRDAWMTVFLASDGSSATSATLPLAGAGLEAPDLSLPAPAGGYRLRARVVGRAASASADDQELRFSVNGAGVGSVQWLQASGLDRIVELGYDPSLLEPDGNTVRVQQPPPADPDRWRFNYVDWVELEYPRRLRAHDDRIDFADEPAAPTTYYLAGFAAATPPRIYVADAAGELTRMLEPRSLRLGPGLPRTIAFTWRGPAGAIRVLGAGDGALLSPTAVYPDTPSALRSAAGAAYVALSHPRFQAEAQALADRRGGMAVSLTDVYDEFGDGVVDSAAIRDFIAWARGHWPTPVRQVALVGDSSFDHRNHRGIPAAEYQPPTLLPARDVYLVGAQDLRAASDSWFGAVAGGDFVPDVAVGRIPARSAGDLDRYRLKLERYEALAEAPWMARIELFADDDVNNNGAECGVPGTIAADFDATVGRWLPAGQPDHLVRRYAGTYAGADAPYQLRRDVIADLRDGTGIQFYSGHGNRTSMARHCVDGSVPVLDFETLAQIGDQQGRYPLAVAMTCDVGEFDYAGWQDTTPVWRALSEDYLLDADGGAIAWLATTSVLPYVTGAEVNDHLFEVLYDPAGSRPRVLGDVALALTLRLFADRGAAAQDIVQTLVVLGDPALRLRATTP